MKKNWYGFNHEAINKKFKGGLTYINDFCVNDEYQPVAVYKVDSPDRSLGHKDFLLIQIDPHNGGGIIRGMNLDEIIPQSKQEAIQCNLCDDIIYSVNRHDFRSCECGNVSIDGGKDYTKISFAKKGSFTNGIINLLTNEFN